jgi:hypothetical protein
MKKHLLFLFFLSHFNFLQAQTLAYTHWMGTKPGSVNLWFNFDNDTLRYSTNGSLGSPLSKFYASNGQFYLYDFSGTALCQDTGFYTYTITSNNLIFSLLTDNCTSRKTTLLNYTWTSLNTAVTTLNSAPEFFIQELQPEGIYLLSVPTLGTINEFSVYDLSGKRVFRNSLNETSLTVNLSTLNKGIYIATYQSEQGTKSVKLFR